MSTEMTPNAPLLLKTLEHIENHPEEWEQGTWHCGTTACFAGHAALLDGGEWLNAKSALMIARADDQTAWSPGTIPSVKVAAIPVEDRAQRVLGLTEEQADRLFAGCNDLDDLRAEVCRLVGDWDALAWHTEAAAMRSINGGFVSPSAYADPALDLDEKHLRLRDLKDAISEWQRGEDGEVDLDTLEPQWRDAEVYTNHLRGLVDDAVHKLIGRPA